MGLFTKKKADPRHVELNLILNISLKESKTPEGIDQEAYDLIGVILQKAFVYAEESAKMFGYPNAMSTKRFIHDEYPWIDKVNLKMIADRAVDRLK